MAAIPLFGFLMGMIFVIFDLQIARILATKFQVNWPVGSGEAVQNRFSTIRTGARVAILDMLNTSSYLFVPDQPHLLSITNLSLYLTNPTCSA